VSECSSWDHNADGIALSPKPSRLSRHSNVKRFALNALKIGTNFPMLSGSTHGFISNSVENRGMQFASFSVEARVVCIHSINAH
jgi:hypothetical protein